MGKKKGAKVRTSSEVTSESSRAAGTATPTSETGDGAVTTPIESGSPTLQQQDSFVAEKPSSPLAVDAAHSRREVEEPSVAQQDDEAIEPIPHYQAPKPKPRRKTDSPPAEQPSVDSRVIPARASGDRTASEARPEEEAEEGEADAVHGVHMVPNPPLTDDARRVQHIMNLCTAGRGVPPSSGEIRLSEREVRDTFALFDADATGTVIAADFACLLRACGVRADKLDAVTTALRGQNSVTVDELRTLLLQHTPLRSASDEAAAAFCVFDPTNKGFIDFDGVRSALDAHDNRIPDEDVRDVLAMCDVDGDGVVSRSDFMSVISFVEVMNQ